MSVAVRRILCTILTLEAKKHKSKPGTWSIMATDTELQALPVCLPSALNGSDLRGGSSSSGGSVKSSRPGATENFGVEQMLSQAQ